MPRPVALITARLAGIARGRAIFMPGVRYAALTTAADGIGRDRGRS
ncbi:hypothetical protein [Mycobacterium sp.]